MLKGPLKVRMLGWTALGGRLVLTCLLTGGCCVLTCPAPNLACPPAGSELSSVQLLDEATAEQQRVALIERLVKEALTADFEGGCCRLL